MTSLTAVNMYLCANGLLVLAVILLATAKVVHTRSRHAIAYGHQLNFGYALTAAALLLPIGGSFFGSAEWLPQTAQVWSAPTMHRDHIAPADDHRVAIALAPTGPAMSLEIAGQVATAIFLSGMTIFLFRIGRDVVATARIVANAQSVRRRGRLIILISNCIQVPFSLWVPTRHFIVMPESLLLRLDDFKIALRHEAQHHRQLDTKLVYLYQLLRTLFFWNPAAHLLATQIRERQEFACDAAVIGQQKTSVSAYCHCLLRVAEEDAAQIRRTLCLGMSGSVTGNLLMRRIKATLQQPNRPLSKSVVGATVAVAITLMTATAFAFSAAIHDRRISIAEANRLAIAAQTDSRFPIVINHRVVEQLNLLLGTPDGRAYLQASLKRMKSHQALIAEKIVQQGLPLELLAVPLVESGYRNLQQGSTEKHGAGLWMFIKTTARHFDLSVDDHNDERLNTAKETDAALRLLGRLYQHYEDWGLALLAYNAGSLQVDKAILETGTRDAWEITRRGYENDPNYLPRVVAAVLVIKNPSMLN